MDAYTKYKKAVNSYNEIISLGLKHGHLNGAYEFEVALPNELIYIKSWDAHLEKINLKLDSICA